jgi:hypothetical protein
MQPANAVRLRQTPHYTLDALHALPCGCVAAVYRTVRLDLEVVSLEARGPHCIHMQHETGKVIGLGMSDDDRLSR